MIFINFLTRQSTLNLVLLIAFFLLFLFNVYHFVRLRVLREHPERSMSLLWTNFLTRHWRWSEIAILALAIITISLSLTLPCKVALPDGPSMGATTISPSSPLQISFNRRVDRKMLNYEINPKLAGEWQYKNSWLSQTEVLEFIPSQTPALDTRYTISLTGIRNIFGRNASNYLFSFQTAPLPELKSASIADGEEGIGANQEILVEIDDGPEEGALFEFTVAPELELNMTKVGNVYHLKPATSFAKGTSYSLKVFRTPTTYDYKAKKIISSGEKSELKTINFRTVDIPAIKATSPTGSGILPDAKISIEFRQDMDPSSAEKLFSLSPSATGTLAWENSRKLLFTPSSGLTKNTIYTVTLAKGAKTAADDIIPEDISFSFTTIGFVSVSKFTPSNGASGITESAPISATFNQSVDHASAEAHFSITPAVAGTFSWSGNTLSFNHANFAVNQKYTATVAAGVKSITGLDSKDTFSTAFTTKIPATSLNVPSFKQAHMYSCMGVAARNALAFKGVNVSEASVLSAIGYDNTAWSGTWAEGGAVWGDPDRGIVGSVDGKANNIGWGYGAHAGPVANAIRGFGRTAEVKSGWDVAGIASQIAAGNPVIVWWVNGVWPAYNVYWKTPGGKSVRGVNSMHVQVVKGFTGTADNPLSFTVTDSGYGYPTQTFDVGTFKAKWGWFGNTAIIVK